MSYGNQPLAATKQHSAYSPAPTSGPIVVRGTGSIGLRHLRVLKDELAIDAIAMPVREGQQERLLSQGFAKVHRELELAALRPWLVVVATDTSRHLQDAEAALRAGAHVLVEKPLAPSIDGAVVLHRLAQDVGRHVFVACNLRFERGLRVFREQLQKIGSVHFVRIECQSYLPDWRPDRDYRDAYCARANEGGVLRDLIHEIDYALWIYGRPSTVSGMLENTGRLGIDAEESAELFWTAPGGAAVSIRLDYLTRIPRRRMRAFGDLGDLEWDLMEERVTLSLAGRLPENIPIVQERNEMMRDQILACMRACNGGEADELATFDEGAFAVAVCDAARLSSATQRSEPIPDWRSS